MGDEAEPTVEELAGLLSEVISLADEAVDRHLTDEKLEAARHRAEYPEHAKLEAIMDKSQTIGEFLDRCEYTVCELVCVRCGVILSGPRKDEEGHGCDDRNERYLPLRQSVERTLAQYFEVDLGKIDQEKRAMLASLRSGKGQSDGR